MILYVLLPPASAIPSNKQTDRKTAAESIFLGLELSTARQLLKSGARWRGNNMRAVECSSRLGFGQAMGGCSVEPLLSYIRTLTLIISKTPQLAIVISGLASQNVPFLSQKIREA